MSLNSQGIDHDKPQLEIYDVYTELAKKVCDSLFEGENKPYAYFIEKINKNGYPGNIDILEGFLNGLRLSVQENGKEKNINQKEKNISKIVAGGIKLIQEKIIFLRSNEGRNKRIADILNKVVPFTGRG